MSVSSLTSASHITRTPGVCGGKPCVAGSRIRVQDVYHWYERQGMSADEIVSRFPQLTHADVFAALAYFWDHREEMNEELRRDEQLLQESRARFPSLLDTKLKASHGTAVSP